MKILYITNKISPSGGLERVLAIKTSGLAEQFQHEVHIVTLNQKDEPVFHDFSPKIRMHDLAVPVGTLSYLTGYISAIRKIIEEINPDLIDVCDDGVKAFLVPWIAGKKYPVVYERHVSKTIEFNSDSTGFVKKLIIRLKFSLMDSLGKNFARFVVLTNGNKLEWSLPNVEVIPNPLTFYPDSTSSLENKKVLAIGRHSFQKGFDHLLQAWKIVSNRHPDWILDLYGKEDPAIGLRKLCKDLQLDGTVQFHDPVKNIEEQYLASSIYALSSRFEGFGMVLTEAMACGVPCVSYDCPCGPSDIITSGEDGILVENGDITQLAEKICFLIENEAERKRMGSNARKSVTRYSGNEILAKWHNLFTGLKKSTT
ncbi:MAG TPA: glycosyltransferase family 4 protein [Catalimonadaceae bacterium]|nr:glycosyltransferase family 4 protein [Catalimonadaceae bacterium]